MKTKNIINFNLLIGIIQVISMILFAIYIYNVPDGEMGLVILFFGAIFLFVLFFGFLIWSIRIFMKYRKGIVLKDQATIVFILWIIAILIEIGIVIKTS